MSIVWTCALSVEAYAQAARQVEVPRPGCPNCGQDLAFSSGEWRYARSARLIHRVWVRRGRCRRCRRSHHLLPSFLLSRRLDTVTVIGEALTRVVAKGEGMRTAAAELGVPHSTLRDWCRRFARRAAMLAAGLAALVVECGGEAPQLPGSPLQAALTAVRALAEEVDPLLVGGGDTGRWELTAVVCGGELLGVAASPPWATPAGRPFIPPHPSMLTEELPHAP